MIITNVDAELNEIREAETEEGFKFLQESLGELIAER